MGSHQSAAAETTTWLTPPGIIDALGTFDLDPCAAPSPRPWPTADRHLELPTDGLAADWEGRVWCNPPYGAQTWAWLSKLATHPGGGIALIFARTETSGFVREVWGKAAGVLFLHGRLHFHADGRRAAANSGAPSCLVAYGSWAADRLRGADLEGTFVSLDNPQTCTTVDTLEGAAAWA
ncbi:MAG: adenine methyltransferase [Microbacterium sp.]|nr:adenine methyltransferase [Microbacterium sp.]